MRKLKDLNAYELMGLTANEDGAVEYEQIDSLLRDDWKNRFKSYWGTGNWFFGFDDCHPISVKLQLPEDGIPLPLERKVVIEIEYTRTPRGYESRHATYTILFFGPKAIWNSKDKCYDVEYECESL